MLAVREATADDIKRIYDISLSALKRDTWTEEMYRKEFSDSTKHYFVAYNTLSPDKLFGFIGYAQVFDEAHIMNLAVAEEFRRKGIGVLLVEEAIKHSKTKGIESMTLEVRVSNNKALGLYKKVGFKSAGIRPDYYPDREGAEILWLYY